MIRDLFWKLRWWSFRRQRRDTEFWAFMHGHPSAGRIAEENDWFGV